MLLAITSSHVPQLSLHARAQDNCIKVVMKPSHMPLVVRQVI